jgi:hypothetical protein
LHIVLHLENQELSMYFMSVLEVNPKVQLELEMPSSAYWCDMVALGKWHFEGLGLRVFFNFLKLSKWIAEKY